jgi:hypothetical protein
MEKKFTIWDKLFSIDNDDMDEPSVIERISWKFRWLADTFRNIKWFFQRVFRSSHASDCDLWGLNHRLAEIILPKLVAFRKKEPHGYPCDFCDWEPSKNDPKYGGLGITKKEYDAAKKKGNYVGGGHKAWMAVIDEMIFAMEHTLVDDSCDEKKEAAFFKKWNMENPQAEIKNNAKIQYKYEEVGKDKPMIMMTEKPPSKVEKKWKLLEKSIHYYNGEAMKKLWDRHQKGMELFGKYFGGLWD